MKCKICDRIAIREYCEPHEKAYRNVIETYNVWRNALGISWGQYLNEVVKNPYTGSWAKDVAEQLIKAEKDKA